MNIQSILKNLEGKEINLFDKNGGVLNLNGTYVPDWFNYSNKFLLENVMDKYFILSAPNGQSVKYKVSRIHSIEGNDIEFNFCL